MIMKLFSWGCLARGAQICLSFYAMCPHIPEKKLWFSYTDPKFLVYFQPHNFFVSCKLFHNCPHIPY